MSNYGIKISKEGFDAKTAETKNLIIDSSKNAFKVFKEASGNGIGTIEIPHGLNFVPCFLAFCELETGEVYSIGASIYSLEEEGFVNFMAHSDIDYLTLDIGGSNESYPYYYYIFGDTAKEIGTNTPLNDPDNYGFRISKEGKSAIQQFVENFIAASDLPAMKVHTVGSQSVDASGGWASANIPHGLPFVPAFMVWARKQGESTYAYTPSYVLDGRHCYAHANATNLVLEAIPGLDRGVYEFKYLIFAERAKA